MTFRPETDGCSELTCIYHGEENQRKIDAHNAAMVETANCSRCQAVLDDELLALRAAEADEAYAEMLRDYEDEKRAGAWEVWGESWQAQWDDDPNPYHGDYAENDGY